MVIRLFNIFCDNKTLVKTQLKIKFVNQQDIRARDSATRGGVEEEEVARWLHDVKHDQLMLPGQSASFAVTAGRDNGV